MLFHRFIRHWQSVGCGLAIAVFLSSVVHSEEDRRHPLIGCWKAISVSEKGVTEEVEGSLRVFENQIMETKTAAGVVTECGYRVNDEAEPKQVDVTLNFGGGATATWPGIYSIEGDTLQICIAGAKRPTDFLTMDGDGRRVTTYRRSGIDFLQKDAIEQK